MKLEYEPIVIQRSQDFEEEVFGISDVTVIMEILRSKLYSNPIKVLVQEYMSNARDAHREVNKSDRAIEVFCPSDISPQFEVRDYGPGLSPDRIKNVFIKYGSSTKRGSNDQTGGFGIGAKSGWSYADTFHVISITKEGGQNVKRSYSCIVDESRAGKLIKMSDDTITHEECGTRIVVPAKKENFRQFRAYAVQAGTFWDTLPIIHGSTIDTPKVISGGSNWKYFKHNTLPPDYGAEKAFVVYDGIPYPLKTETLKDSISKTVMDVLNCACFGLYFGIGDITISANREEIQYTEKTRNELAKRVNEMVEDVASKFSDTIQQEKTFIGALLKFNGICRDNSIIAKLINDAVEWNGIKLHEMTQLGSHANTVKIENFFGEGGKLCHRKSVYISIDGKSDLKNIYVNDEPLRGAPRAKFESMYHRSTDKDNFDVYVISFHTNNTKGLNQAELDAANTRIRKWKKESYIDSFNFPKTSSVKKTAYPKGVPTIKTKTGKMVKYRSMKLNTEIYLEEHEDFDSTLAGYYVINYDGNVRMGGQHFNIRDRYETRRMSSRFSLIIKHLKIDSVLVFTPKYIKLIQENKALIPLPADIQDQIVKAVDVSKFKEYIDYLDSDRSYNHDFFKLLKPETHMNSFIPKSKVRKKLESMVKSTTYRESADYKAVEPLYREFSGTISAVYKLAPKNSTEDPEEPFNNRYPLLSSSHRYGYANDEKEREKFIEHAISYINLVDNAKI